MSLADDALKMGLRIPSIPVKPVCMPFTDTVLKTDWAYDFSSLFYPETPLTEMVNLHVQAQLRAAWRRENQAAFLLWGIHK